jgi:hypothetical protein
MTQTAAESLRGYLRQLAPQTRAKLLAEIERLRLNGDEIPGADIIVAELRADARPEVRLDDRRLEPATRYFFLPVEPYLVDHPPERAKAGRISRDGLQSIWDWLSRDLIASMARDYTKEMRQLIASNQTREAERTVQAFQNKAAKYLEGTLASTSGAAQARSRLGGQAGSSAGVDELGKILCVLRAREALAQFAQSLPVKIDKFVDERLATTKAGLDALAAAHPNAMPFGLTLVARRLTQPWQLIRLATKAVDSKEAAEIAATPYAMAVDMVFDQLEDQVDLLRAALREERIVRAKEILVEIYDAEYAIQVRIHLSDSEWGYRLDDIMDLVARVLDSEQSSVPDGLNHILRSNRLKQHLSVMGQLTRLGWKCRDALNDGMTIGRNLVSALRR